MSGPNKPARGKTTPASNNGSFSTYTHGVADVALDDGQPSQCGGCRRPTPASGLSGTGKCAACVSVDVHNYRALHDGRMKRREYDYAPGTETGAAAGAKTVDETSTQACLPPGAHKVVDCPRCDPSVGTHIHCDLCRGEGTITTDRYDQTPWNPGVPGTRLAVQVAQGPQRVWKHATVVNSDRTRSLHTGKPSAYAVADFDPATKNGGGEIHEVYLPDTLPPLAAEAAERHGICAAEMIQEAAEEMALPGLNPTLEETRGFLASISPAYLDDIAFSASQYRSHLAERLRESGKTGPDLDQNFDTSLLPAGALDRDIEAIRTDHLPAEMVVRSREHWRGCTVVYDPALGFTRTYNDDAWTPPTEQPMLPWRPPAGVPVAHVAVDGTVTRVDQKA